MAHAVRAVPPQQKPSEPQNIADMRAELAALTDRFELLTILDHGAYGVVISGIDKAFENSPVVLKRTATVTWETVETARKFLREASLLAHFAKHPNILLIRDICVPAGTADFTGSYVVSSRLDTTVKNILRSGRGECGLGERHVQTILWQVLHALASIHSAGVIHRAVTPSNILLLDSGKAVLGDFGQASEVPQGTEDLTDYVTMRYYRAPECAMESHSYDHRVDLWSLGCVAAELLGAKPICQGADSVKQLDAIVNLVGKPSDDDIASMGASADAKKYVAGLFNAPPKGWKDILPHASAQAVDFLGKLLQFHPKNRMFANDALRHPFLAPAAAQDVAVGGAKAFVGAAALDNFVGGRAAPAMPTFTMPRCDSVADAKAQLRTLALQVRAGDAARQSVRPTELASPMGGRKAWERAFDDV